MTHAGVDNEISCLKKFFCPQNLCCTLISMTRMGLRNSKTRPRSPDGNAPDSAEKESKQPKVDPELIQPAEPNAKEIAAAKAARARLGFEDGAEV